MRQAREGLKRPRLKTMCSPTFEDHRMTVAERDDSSINDIQVA